MTAAAALTCVPVIYREAVLDDEGFIYNSWLKSHRTGAAWARDVPPQVYFAGHKKVVASLLAESEIVVACNPESPAQIFGYAVYQASSAGVLVLHYLYVKHPYRKLGIATALYRQVERLAGHDLDLPAIATHVTGVWSDVLKDRWHMIYNPYVIGA